MEHIYLQQMIIIFLLVESGQNQNVRKVTTLHLYYSYTYHSNILCCNNSLKNIFAKCLPKEFKQSVVHQQLQQFSSNHSTRLIQKFDLKTTESNLFIFPLFFYQVHGTVYCIILVFSRGVELLLVPSNIFEIPKSFYIILVEKTNKYG